MTSMMSPDLSVMVAYIFVCLYTYMFIYLLYAYITKYCSCCMIYYCISPSISHPIFLSFGWVCDLYSGVTYILKLYIKHTYSPCYSLFNYYHNKIKCLFLVSDLVKYTDICFAFFGWCDLESRK